MFKNESENGELKLGGSENGELKLGGSENGELKFAFTTKTEIIKQIELRLGMKLA